MPYPLPVGLGDLRGLFIPTPRPREENPRWSLGRLSCEWIHAQRVKHKDIKPSNILIHGTNPVIADMGISHGFDNDSKSSGPSAGSRTCRALEIIEQPEERPYARYLAEAICKQRPYKYIGECCVLNDTVNTSSTLNNAVDATSSALPNPEDLEKGSLLHFVASTALSLGKSDIPEACPSLDTLYRQVSNRAICSVRSAEKKFLLIIAPVRLLSIPVQHGY